MFFLNNPWSSRMYLFSKKPSSSELGLGFSKTLRKEGDSNPRYGYPYDSLANCWFQPLTHPSPRLSVIRHALSEMLFFESACKGTTKNAHVQIFLEKNAFLDKKSAHGLHFTRFFAYHSVTTLTFPPPPQPDYFSMMIVKGTSEW